MPKLDAFSKQIVDMVRQMPDEAILDLIKNQLGVDGAGVAAPASEPAAPKRSASPKPAAKAKKRASKKRSRKGAGQVSAARQKALATVEKVIKASQGLSASEIASKSKIPQSRVSSLVRELKKQGRIHQGGDRRFARYAGDANTAKKASEDARKNAPGPQIKGKRSRRKKS